MDLKVESEIYSENNFDLDSSENSSAVVDIGFSYNFPNCCGNEQIVVDEDGDLVVRRRNLYNLKIELRKSTNLSMVGLQLWRGAFVLADFILENGPSMFTSKNVLELGSGVGLTSIVASFFAQKMVSTDVPAEGILELIDRNFKRNSGFVKSSYRVMPFDFFDQEWSEELCSIVSETDIVLAADVVYDDSLTEAFVETLTKILSTEKKKTIFVALEKRYVFTVADLDTVAPCYEYFLECIRRVWNKPPMSQWGMKSLSINFARYFIYKRNSDIVLWQITN